MLAAVIAPMHEAVSVLRDAGDAHAELVRHQREVRHCARVDTIKRTVCQRRCSTTATRLLGKQLDRAADRVSPSERALWTSQNFDALEIEQIDKRTGQRRVIHIVDIQTDA